MRCLARRHDGACVRQSSVVITLAFGITIAGAGLAKAQSGTTTSDAVPPAASSTVPAEVQPGHPPPAATGSLGASGPQAATPTPQPPGKADTPGGAARNGVVSPPAVTGDREINRGAPGTSSLGTPVITPPGTDGATGSAVPK